MNTRLQRSWSERFFDYGNLLFMIVLIMITFYPMLYIVFASLSDPTLLAQHRGVLVSPLSFSIDAYIRVFQNSNILTGYRNTIFYVVVGTTLDVVLTTLGAFVLSRRNVLWEEPILFLIIFTMFFSGGLIPTYLLVSRGLGWVNSPLAIIVPGAIQTFNLIIMRTAFLEVPFELEEAAKMDGANDFQVLVHIYLPLVKPVLAVIILFYAVGHWNSFFPALIYLRDRNLYPLQLILREILIQNNTDAMTTTTATGEVQMVAETVKYATIVVVTLPILIIYPFLQRYFVKGVLIGGIKG